MRTNFYTARNIFCSRERCARYSRTLTILLLALSGFFSGYTQTTPLSFTQIPYGNADLIAPGRGVEHWNGVSWDNNSGIQIPAGNTQALNYYARFNWVDIESSGSQGSYSWTAFDNQMHKAMDAGAMFSFGVMPMCSGCGLGGYGYPTYLHNLMQGEGSNSVDWQNSDGLWVPNWNSPNWLSRWAALMTAIANHINSTTYNGKNYKDAIYYIDVRGFGDYGEWHTYPWTGTEPSGRTATVASLESIVNAVKSAFPNYPLQIAMGAFDTKNASMMPPEFCYYALTTSNAWGQIGWRRDNLGDAGYASYLSGNPGSYSGNSFSTLIMNKWKYAPIGGEPANDANAISRNCGVLQCDLVNEITTFHIASFGNGNYPVSASDGNLKANVTAASKASGYRLILSGGSMTTTLSGGGAFNITLNWQNIGVTPTYENWNVVYELRNSSGGVVWTGNSAFSPKLFLPQGSATGASDNFTLSSVSPGTYSMYLIVRDPTNYKKPLPLAVNGRNSDGSYLLRSNITVGTGTANQSPTADAGSDKTIQLPTSNAALAGTGKDADGTVASYAWTKVSGPAGGTLSSPTTANTNVSGMLAGVYVYSLTVTDNQGATATAKVQITVNAAAMANQSPVAKAGSDISISLPTNQVTLDGSASGDPDGSIASYAWAKISGPAQFSISNSTSASTSVKNLAAGVYSFQLKVTDNGGATALDTIVVTVTTGIPQNQPPVANAGSNITVTLPTNVANLNGSASQDPDGTISTYTWSQTSGPSAATMASASTASTGISGLVQGSYNFMLKVTDNSGATDTDTVIVTVDVPNQSPTANAGVDQTITAPANTVNLDGSGSYDPDGSLSSYSWAKVSGPGTITISNSNTATPSVIGLQAGSYVFELIVADNKGATAKDQVTITVNPKPGQPNQLPVANAGNNLTITLPVSSINLNAGSSFDPDGTITAYSWQQLSGPSTSMIAGGSSVAPTVSQLDMVGQYTFDLTVTDNNGATSQDQVTVTVNPSVAKANQAPVADAGSGDTLNLPVSNYILDATHSTDPDGSISSYQWQELTGPNMVTSSPMNESKVNISGFQPGEYEFQVTVTDNLGASSTAIDKITVIQGSVAFNRLVIYPNPAHDVVNGRIISSVMGTVRVTIYDMNGRQVLTDQIEKSGDEVDKAFDISQLASGMYMIHINIGNRKTMIRKFIKN